MKRSLDRIGRIAVWRKWKERCRVEKVGNKEQATKEQTVHKNMILNKDANIENAKSEGEARREDEQYGKTLI